MIPKKFHLFWCGDTMSYLRYMTLVTLRHHHPDWEINLHTSKKYAQMTWVHEAQDFQQKFDDDFLPKACEIADNVRVYEKHTDVAPNFQSDFFRWDILEEEGGFYLDTDQIILKPFDDLLTHQFIYALYEANGPVGVLGAEPHLQIVRYIQERIIKLYSPSNYNSIGPQMFIKVMKEVGGKDWWKKTGRWNSKHAFYPIAYSHGVPNIYSGKHNPPDSAYALHWFGGHPVSQKFNKKFTPEFAKTSDDTISRRLRCFGILQS